MGRLIEINDTLKINKDQGFPDNIEIDKEYSFNKSGVRVYHSYPTRVFLVEEKEGKWNYIGHAMILKQTIDAIKGETSGVFKLVQQYSEEYQKLVNQNEPPEENRL